MGEVYRADDLKLGQAVALKFLDRELSTDLDRVRRFFDEVRLGRRVSHPNVCRVYDVGDAAGLHFIAMEYIDGEDLASLLRRVERLPSEKAVEIARQLCAGLEAAHDRGVLHRDLKPSNIMIDGRGRVRVTDFGLAMPVEAGAARGEVTGTPAYMSPEQAAGEPVTGRSDLFSLGLVIYELFTGARVFDVRSIEERWRSGDVVPRKPSLIAPGIDSSVERVILQCLETDPHKRPASASAVARVLPRGDDPLDAAVAAGETPSPEMVAAAHQVGNLAPYAAWVCLLALIAGLLTVVQLARSTTLHGRTPLPMSTDVLA